MSDLPQVEKAPEQSGEAAQVMPVYMGQFAPGFGFDLKDLIELMIGFGSLNAGPFTGQDQAGNYINAQGQIVIPAHLARHYQATQVQPTGA